MSDDASLLPLPEMLVVGNYSIYGFVVNSPWKKRKEESNVMLIRRRQLGGEGGVEVWRL